MDHAVFERKCWSYYLELENRFLYTLQYVTLCEDNFNTYSNEFFNLLLLICAEIESVMKVATNNLSNKNANIKYLTNVLFKIYPSIRTISVTILYLNNKLIKPLENVNLEEKQEYSEWWTSHNEIKHNRLEFETKANLKNTLYALSTLYILNINFLYMSAEDNTKDSPRISSLFFKTNDINWRIVNGSEVNCEIQKVEV